MSIRVRVVSLPDAFERSVDKYSLRFIEGSHTFIWSH